MTRAKLIPGVLLFKSLALRVGRMTWRIEFRDGGDYPRHVTSNKSYSSKTGRAPAEREARDVARLLRIRITEVISL